MTCHREWVPTCPLERGEAEDRAGSSPPAQSLMETTCHSPKPPANGTMSNHGDFAGREASQNCRRFHARFPALWQLLTVPARRIHSVKLGAVLCAVRCLAAPLASTH